MADSPPYNTCEALKECVVSSTLVVLINAHCVSLPGLICLGLLALCFGRQTCLVFPSLDSAYTNSRPYRSGSLEHTKQQLAFGVLLAHQPALLQRRYFMTPLHIGKQTFQPCRV